MRVFMPNGSKSYIPRDCKAESCDFRIRRKAYESAHPRFFDGIRHWHVHAGVVPLEQDRAIGCDMCVSFIHHCFNPST